MEEPDSTRQHAVRTIDGVEALVNLDSGELFLDLPLHTPRYIRVREGDQIQEGDVATQTSQTMNSQTLSKWKIETISIDTVTGVDVDTGESQEWDREWLTRHLGTGGFSVELTDFGRVNVSESTGHGGSQSDDQQDAPTSHVNVSVYGNNGQKYTQTYTATEPDDWESLELVEQDPPVEEFDEELREKFDDAVTRALEFEQRYHK